jgi:hypothetical protein
MWCINRHILNKHEMRNEEFVEHPLPMRSKENHGNQCKEVEEAELIKESIEVYKIYLLLQRMKTKPNPY